VTLRLTPTEWRILAILLDRPGQLVASAQILTKVWGPEYRDDLQYLRVWISRVRRKLGADVVRTVHGVGYALETPR